MIITEDAYLEHVGVKGMRWGVRKDFKRANENFGKISNEVNVRQEQRRLNATITEEKYKKLDNVDVVIKKGSIVKRITNSPTGDASRDDLYVSTNKSDAEFYKALIPTTNTGGIPSKSHKGYYETTLSVVNDLKSPSEKKRVQAYIRLMDAKSIELSNGEKVNGREYLRRQGLGKTVDAFSSKQLALTYYGQLVVNQGIRNDPINTALFKDLSKRGYNAVVDDNDRGVLSKQPILTLDARKSLKTIEIKSLSTKDIRKAQMEIKLPD